MFARIFYVWFWFGSNRYTVLFRRLVGCGDAFPSKWSLKVEKGDYTVRVHIRHEKRELLDRSDQIPQPLHGTSTGTGAQSCPCFLLSRQAVLLIRNDLFRILPIENLEIIKNLMLIINQKEESIGTNYLSSYFSHYPYSIQRPKIRNKILIHLLLHSRRVQIRNK